MIINIEGVDGSGKGTQFHLLGERLKERGLDVASFSFPNLDTESGEQISRILRGEITADPYETATLYAQNRLEQKDHIVAAVGRGAIALFDRYVPSNIVFQTARLDTDQQKLSMSNWITSMEYSWNGIPKPDTNIVLAVDPKVAQRNMIGRDPREYAESLDVFEADRALQAKIHATYEELCKKDPSFIEVDCVDPQTKLMRDKSVIHAEIWSIVARKLGIEG